MRFLLALILLLPFALDAETAFTEFYTDYAVGTNINSGHTTNATALYTTVNGNWDGTSVFTPTDGSTPASTVTNGGWVAVYIDNSTNLIQSSAGGFVALVTNVAAGVNGAITINRAAFMGTAPSSSATGRSLKFGGCWNGPYGTIGFPFGFLATTATNAPNVFPRCNLKATATYSVTAAMTHANNGPIRFQGMTLVPDDRGKATIDGGPTGTSYVVLTASGVNNDFADLVFTNNGNSGTANLLACSGNYQIWVRVVVTGARRSGFSGNSIASFIECEAFDCNRANTASHAGFNLGGAQVCLIRCISRDNPGNGIGCLLSSPATLINCIFESNGQGGVVTSTTTGTMRISGCDFYNNGTDGINMSGAGGPVTLDAQNCNFIGNVNFGINSSASALRTGQIINCGFGSGSMTNGSGSIASNASVIYESGSVLYASNLTPWVDPANGDFRIILSASKATGRGSFTQLAVNAPTNTVSFPDIGAAQSASTNASTSAYTFSQ